jgi:hypothetical protein
VWPADLKRHLKNKHGQQKSNLKQQLSPLYWFFFYDSGKQIVYDVRHVAQGFPLIQL